MAKVRGSAKEVRKITFGKRKNGKAKKSRGPKDKKTSQYRGQGR